jgi:hypothetical protein
VAKQPSIGDNMWHVHSGPIAAIHRRSVTALVRLPVGDRRRRVSGHRCRSGIRHDDHVRPWRLLADRAQPNAASEAFAINPGQTRTIDMTIKPSGKAGTVVRGDLYVDDSTVIGQVESGSEIAVIPYAYTIG